MRRSIALLAAGAALGVAAPAWAQGTNSAVSGGDSTSSSSGSSATSGSSGTGTGGDASGSAGGGANGPMTSEQAAGMQPAPPPDDPNSRTGPEWLLQRRRTAEYGLGVRFWTMGIPRFIVSPFVHIDPQSPWGGHLGIAVAPEFFYRYNQLEIQVGIQFSTYMAPPTFFHGTNEPQEAFEVILPRLWGLYATSHFMWGIPFHRMVELQIGVGVGVGYIGGDLFRSQAFRDGSGTLRDCGRASGPGGGATVQGGSFQAWCENPNNGHYSQGDLAAQAPGTGAFRESSFFSGGSLPSILPWVSIPQLSLHVRPHPRVDVRIDGGFALIGFYGGGAAHVMF